MTFCLKCEITWRFSDEERKYEKMSSVDQSPHGDDCFFFVKANTNAIDCDNSR